MYAVAWGGAGVTHGYNNYQLVPQLKVTNVKSFISRSLACSLMYSARSQKPDHCHLHCLDGWLLRVHNFNSVIQIQAPAKVQSFCKGPGSCKI